MRVAGFTVSTFRAFDGRVQSEIPGPLLLVPDRVAGVTCSYGGGATLDQINLGALIAHLRQELDQIDHLILALERVAMAREAGARLRGRRNLRVRAGKMWTKHHALKK